MGARELRIRPDRTFETGPRQHCISGREAVEMTEADMIVGPSVKAFDIAEPCKARLVQGNVGLKRRNQVRHDARPQISDLVDRSDQPISPDNFSGTGLRQLQRHSDGAARILDDPGQDIARCQCGRHEIQIGLDLPEAEGRASRDHREPAQPRQRLDDLVRYRIAQNGEVRRHAERLER